MFTGLYRRLALTLLIVFIAKGSYLVWKFDQSAQIAHQKIWQELHVDLADYVVNDVGVLDGNEFNPEMSREAFRRMMLLGPSTEFYILDPQGKVLISNDADEKITRNHVDLLPIERFINRESLPILGDDPRSLWQTKIFSAAKIFDEQRKFRGYLYIIIGGENYDNIVTNVSESTAWDLSIPTISAGLVFLLAATLILFYAMTRPLNRLSRDVARFERSDFKDLPAIIESKPSKDNELQQLRRTFYRMGKRINIQLEHLQEQDLLRREFLAYVSHDLRTPLAGMQAYLETLSSKHNELSQAERQKFIDNTYLNSQRLSEMIDELFELARLDHGEIEIHQECFVLSDLLSDLYAGMSELANQKGIHLIMDCPDMSLTVYADVARLERILQNLISNAIFYTPLGGTVTTLISRNADNRIDISIEDTGKGIPEEELLYIFEPYYRAIDGKKTRQDGCGLGLAITQRLLALHKATLHVESTEGKGTRFYFTLREDKE